MKNTVHINLWAGPSTGKSGVSGKLFGKFKENSIDCELVREVAKDYAWNGTLTNTEQLVITAKQYERADRKSTRLNSSHSQQSRMPSSA